MFPVQASGRRIDKPTDICSFGVVLNEMLTGASDYVGETASDSTGSVLLINIDYAQLPPNTHANDQRVLSHCLERDKHLRHRDIGDVRIDLLQSDEPHEDGSTRRARSLTFTRSRRFAAQMC